MKVLRLTWEAYRLLICLYPPDLRRMHGDEMREVFRRQTLDAYDEGAFAFLRVLECAAAELFTCALPLRVQSPAAIVGATSFLSASVIFVALLWALNNPIAVQHLGRDFSRAVFHTMR